VLKRDDGQGLTEYALILATVALVSIAAMGFLGGRMTAALSSVGSSISPGSMATTVTQSVQTTTTPTTTTPRKTKKHT